MKIKACILLLISGCLLLQACQKDVDVFVPDPGQLNGADTTWKATVTASMQVSLLRTNLLAAPHLDSIEVNAATATVLLPDGALVTFPPFCCVNANGQTVTGKVQVEMIVIKKKGDMIRFNKPSTYNDSLLVTAGELFIKLKRDNQTLSLAPNARINIRYVDLPVNQLVKFFVGDESNPDRFNWLPNPDIANNTIAITPLAYEIQTNRLRWISLAHLYDFNNAGSVRIAANMAAYFTNSNTTAFTVFRDFKSVAGMHGEFSLRKFVSGKLPVGKQVTVVVISKQGDDYYLGTESAVTQSPSSGAAFQTVHIVPVKRSLPQILSYLSTL